MALERFNAASIATIDGGRIGVALEQAIDRARLDCVDRPALEKPRKILLEVTVLPVIGQERLDSCGVTFQIKESLPGRESKTFNMRAGANGLFYNELSPEDAAQLTIEPGPQLNAGAAPTTTKGGKVHAG